jgi:hypothetical protein
MPLLRVRPLHAEGLVLALVMSADRDDCRIDVIAIGAEQAGAPSFETINQTLAGGAITTAAFPINQSACSAIISFPDPELVGLFFK